MAVIPLALGGCAHGRRQAEGFLEAARQYVPAARSFAALNLKQPSTEDLSKLAVNEPAISHVNFSTVHYHWPNLCTVLASPPPCVPQVIFDNRKR